MKKRTLQYVAREKRKGAAIPLITEPLHKHTFHITCMKGKIKKESQREVKRQRESEQQQNEQ